MGNKVDTEMRRKELVAKLRRSTLQLVELIDIEAPDFLLATELESVFLCGMVVCGGDFWHDLGEWIEKRARVYHGLCPDCSSYVPIQLAHLPICEQCEAKIEDEVKRIDAELGDEKDE